VTRMNEKERKDKKEALAIKNAAVSRMNKEDKKEAAKEALAGKQAVGMALSKPVMADYVGDFNGYQREKYE